VITRILVIEDDPASLELFQYILSAHGYATMTAARGDDGLAAARSQRPDLVICDIQLPGLDGYAIAAQLKSDATLKSVPLVALTALAMVGDREKVLAAGFDAYVSKPIDPSTFVAQIEPLLKAEQRQRRAQQPPPLAGSATRAAARATVLVVDDAPENQDLKRSILEPFGYEVLCAGTVADALELVRKRPASLIVSDIGLPDASGLDLLQALKSEPELARIPVVIITSSHPERSMQAAAMRLGAARFLVRPLDASEVLREVESCLAEATRGESRGQDSHR
jgi:two-component system, cell cycle response regulator